MTKQGLKISVITPSFNSADYIERAIESVLNQDYYNWEHVIIDGGSKDGTLDILKKYRHLKWISEPDNGQADAMNKGFKISTGDVIVYLNADDYFFPGAFSAVISEFQKEVKFVVGNILVKSPRLNGEFMNIPRTTLSGMLRHWEPNAFCHNPVGYFYLREVQETCPFNAENYTTMDLEFLLDAATKYPFAKIEYTLGCFEDGKNTKTGNTQAMLDYWQPKTFPYLEKHINSLPKEEKQNYEDDRRKGYAAMQATMNKLNESSFEPIPVKDLPLISVIVLTYNCEAYIRRSIDSVLEQELKNLEIIVVDDASTDKTQEVLKIHYKNNPFVNVILHAENKKQGASRNTGLDRAKGKYVFFLDSDDWLEKGALVHLTSIAEMYQAEIVACGVRKTWKDNRKEPYHAHAFACRGGREALYHFSDYRIGSIVWNKLYLRDFIEDHKLRFIVPYWFEDVVFTINAIYACKNYISIENVYYNYYQREGAYSYSTPALPNLKSILNLYLKMIEFIKRADLVRDEEGKDLSFRLLRAHCSNDVYNRMVHYVDTRSREEWENDFRSVFFDMLGVEGYALSDFVIRAMNERNESSSGLEKNKMSINIYLDKWRAQMKFAIFSPQKFFKRYVEKFLNNPLRQR
jgi:glycosyltransferase involved in cell wall biosynthesis